MAGLLSRWRPLAATLMGGITYISSSGVIAKGLTELRPPEQSGNAGCPLGASAGGPGDGDLPALSRCLLPVTTTRRRCRALRFDRYGGGLRCIGDCRALSKQHQPFGGPPIRQGHSAHDLRGGSVGG